MSPINVYVLKILLPIGDFARIERKQNGIQSCNGSNKKNIRVNLTITNKKNSGRSTSTFRCFLVKMQL